MRGPESTFVASPALPRMPASSLSFCGVLEAHRIRGASIISRHARFRERWWKPGYVHRTSTAGWAIISLASSSVKEKIFKTGKVDTSASKPSADGYESIRLPQRQRNRREKLLFGMQ